MSREPVVKQVEGAEVPVEVLAESVVAIGDAMRRLKAGKLNDRALVILVSHAAGVPQATVKTVLSGLERLEKMYLKGGR